MAAVAMKMTKMLKKLDVTGNITGKLSEVWSEFNIFFTLVTMATAAILNFFQPLKSATHYGGYSYKVS
jgi:hypothetical protein